MFVITRLEGGRASVFISFLSQERRRQLELPGLFSKLTNFRQKNSQVEEERSYGHLGGTVGTLTRQTGTLTRYHKDSEQFYYGPMKNLQESDRDMSSSSPVLLEMYDHVKVTTDTSFINYGNVLLITQLSGQVSLMTIHLIF